VTGVEEPKMIDLSSGDIAQKRREELLSLFPEANTEGGKIDFDRLRLALNAAIEVGKERYGLTWRGKGDCFKTIQAPSLGTLRPIPKDSVNWDTTENVIIEGDNLEVLKLLQKAYLGKVKMIYIDPPYNTGNDFIYPDDYSESLQTYLEYTGQVDAESKKFSTNAETDGRFHSKWLSMMYPRLYLARNLLREDGVIFVSIDDTEARNLRSMLDEIFGEGNFLATFIWNKQHSQQQGVFKRYHEYVFAYARNSARISPISGGEGEVVAGALKRVSRSNPASEFTFPPGVRFEAPDGTRLTGTFGDSEKVTVVAGELSANDGRTVETVTLSAGWTQKEQMRRYFAGEDVVDSRGQRVVEFFFNSSGKLKCRKDRSRITPPTTLPPFGMVSEQTAYIQRLFGRPVFDNPKPVEMLRLFISWFVETGDIVLDFFSGSGTTGDALLRQQPDARFILVQLPEPVDELSEAGKHAKALGLETISALGRERVRLVSKALEEESQGDPQPGFRMFRLAESNFTAWNSQPDGNDLEQRLERHVNHIRPDREPLDLVYELLLKSGFHLGVEVEAQGSRDTYAVGSGELIVCLAMGLSIDAIESIAARGPERVVLLDEGFSGSDGLKANAIKLLDSKGVTLRTV
jgi:adenine-specific DNA-methyltransferase